MRPLLDVRNLDVNFHGGIHAVRGVSFQLYPGEILGLVGESGSGKSATAQALMGLINEKKHRVEHEALFKGNPLVPSQHCGKELGMVFQNPMTSLNPTMRIGSQLTEGIRTHLRLSHTECKRKAVSLLHQVGFSDPEIRMGSYPHQLSGGMRQRVGIAIALAVRPSLLFADEPTTALDVTIQAQILDLLQRLQNEHQMGILLLTHDLGIVAQVCDRVAVMLEGKIVECQHIDALFSDPKHPYTKSLLEAVESRC